MLTYLQCVCLYHCPVHHSLLPACYSHSDAESCFSCKNSTDTQELRHKELVSWAWAALRPCHISIKVNTLDVVTVLKQDKWPFSVCWLGLTQFVLACQPITAGISINRAPGLVFNWWCNLVAGRKCCHCMFLQTSNMPHLHVSYIKWRIIYAECHQEVDEIVDGVTPRQYACQAAEHC